MLTWLTAARLDRVPSHLRAVTSFVGLRKQAKVVMYMTWGYHDGNTAACPSSDNTKCFPLGSLANLTSPPCATDPHYNHLAGSFPCMGYALARGYHSCMAASVGADMMAPCGLAWQVVRGMTAIPSACASLVDAQYTAPYALPVPHVPAGALPGFMLYRQFGSTIDKHPNVAGQYLNALTFYATLFGKSPVGAPLPLNTGSTAAGDRPLTAAEATALQTAAAGIVKQCGKACGL